MRRLSLLLVLLAFCAGCPKKDAAAAGGDAAPEASTAPVTSATAPPADPTPKNASSIARFPGETKLGNEKEKVLADVSIVREGPGTGTVVATLKKGVEVMKVAKNGDYFLVVFPDPKAPSEWLTGWVGKAAFVASPPPRSCPKGQTAFIGVGCQVECASDGSCPGGMKCTGYGAKIGVDTAFAYCEAPLDAGKPAAADAGKK
jgi:hypothetical protein